MKKVIDYIFVLGAFLFLNFAGLAMGSMWTDPGVSSLWYENIDKAPWTPPGFVFGLAWTTIMICFSVLMTSLYNRKESKFNKLLLLSWLLNIIWNPLFFTLHWVWLSSFVILALTVVIGKILHELRFNYKNEWILVLPYFVWLNIATSLNLYVALMN